jgi:hypothetical protein
LSRRGTARRALVLCLTSTPHYIFPPFLLNSHQMDPLRDLGRLLLLLGAALAFVGALLYLGAKLPLRLGKLPGDIIHHGEHTTFYFPVVTCLVLSAALSFLFWLFSHFRR